MERLVIQYIVTVSKYGHSALNIPRAYSTGILRCALYCLSRRKRGGFSSCFLFVCNKRRKMCFVTNVLNNKTIILLSLAAYHLSLD